MRNVGLARFGNQDCRRRKRVVWTRSAARRKRKAQAGRWSALSGATSKTHEARSGDPAIRRSGDPAIRRSGDYTEGRPVNVCQAHSRAPGDGRKSLANRMSSVSCHGIVPEPVPRKPAQASAGHRLVPLREPYAEPETKAIYSYSRARSCLHGNGRARD